MSRRKGKKIHRRGPNVFNKHNRRKAILKKIGLGILALMIIPAGFFSAKLILENDSRPAETSSSTKTTISSNSTSPSTTTTTGNTSVTPGDIGSLRAFYIKVSALTDQGNLDSVLGQAADAGFNAVVFDLKDEKGVLHYKSATQLADKSKAASDNAVALDDLKAINRRIKDKGFIAIPRIYAFRDPLSPFNLPSAKIKLDEYPSYTWLDNSKEKGGKPWLNPYAPDAHRYIIGLAEELADSGFSAVIIDGVQFPNQTSRAFYGDSELTSLSHIEVLKRFVRDLNTAVGDHCKVIQAMPGLSAFGDGTEPFGGNPVTLGADTIAPVLMPSTLGKKLKAGETTLTNPSGSPYDAVKLAAGQISLRLELMEKDGRPDIMPWLQAKDYNADQVNGQIKAVTEALGDKASFILYHPNGAYDFDSIKG